MEINSESPSHSNLGCDESVICVRCPSENVIVSVYFDEGAANDATVSNMAVAINVSRLFIDILFLKLLLFAKIIIC